MKKVGGRGKGLAREFSDGETVLAGAMDYERGGVRGAGREFGIIAEIALEKNRYRFFGRIAVIANIAGEAGFELGAPVGFDEDERVEQRAEIGVGGDFAVAEEDGAGGDGGRWTVFAGDGIVGGALERFSGSGGPEAIFETGKIVPIGVRAEEIEGLALDARETEIVEREKLGAGNTMEEPMGEGGLSASSGPADAQDERSRSARGEDPRGDLFEGGG